MKSKIYNLIILDQSGSMSSICNQAIAGVNETIGTIKADDRKNSEDCEQFISLVAFCGCNTSFIMENVPAQEAKTITQNDYSPCCSTPLYDAMGMSLTKLHNLIKDQKAIASVTIITDGYENSSREYDHKAVKALIDRLKAEGWMFAYIGADHDVESVSISLSIDHHIKFDKSARGTQGMFARERASRSSWSRKCAMLSRMLKDSDDCSAFASNMVKVNKEEYFVDDNDNDNNDNNDNK